MFQTFEVKSNPAAVAPRIALVRQAMLRSGFDALLVPHGDEYQNEYLPPCAERLAWLTGFTGSAGFAIVTQNAAVLFVDGRYGLQAREQTDTAIVTIESLVDLPPEEWLAKNTRAGWKIGHDPHLLTIAAQSRFAAKIEKAGAELVAASNLVDAVWNDRPAPPSGKVSIQKMKHAGERSLDKLARLGGILRENGADYCLLTDPVSIAWTFNIRGDDIAHIPVTLAQAVLRKEGRPLLFIDSAKLNRETDAYLTQLADIFPPQAMETELRTLARGAKVMCDPERVSAALADKVTAAGGQIVKARDPVVLPRAIKNETEIAGSRAAHLRDGVAVTRFLAWLDHQPAGSLDEITAASKLEEMRATTAHALGSRLLEISFDTISGAGPNGAIVHYRVNEASNARLAPHSLYLVDSGAQYRDGTTDITRTVAIGTPPVQACEDFTLVLKGHIAIATARFPKGTRGVDIDVLARIALWRHGRDYAHGTGHGIGSYLSVHEGPQSISRRGMEPLVAGMIISNEPGFYREGQWGIRIENLVLVEPARALYGGNAETHGFDTLTLAPIDQRLIDTALMTREELVWLDAYHARVLAELVAAPGRAGSKLAGKRLPPLAWLEQVPKRHQHYEAEGHGRNRPQPQGHEADENDGDCLRRSVGKGRRHDQRRHHRDRNGLQPRLDTRMDPLEPRQQHMPANAREVGHHRQHDDENHDIPVNAALKHATSPLARQSPPPRCRQMRRARYARASPAACMQAAKPCR